MHDYPASPHRPTDKLSEHQKGCLDEMCSDMPASHIRHAGNHLHNMADKMEEHLSNNVTMDDFKKAKKRGDLDMDGDSKANDTDNDGM